MVAPNTYPEQASAGVARGPGVGGAESRPTVRSAVSRSRRR